MATRRGLIAAAVLAPAAAARAQALARPARIVAGFPAGGTVDVVSRLLAERLRGGYAPSLVVENRAGAAGRLAIEHVRTQEADGSTVLISPAGMITIFPHIYGAALRYDPLTDLTPVSPVCLYPFGLAAGPAAGEVRSLDQLIQAARANPGRGFANPAAGSAPHFLSVQLAQKAGYEAVQASYRGAAPALQDVLSASVPFTWNVIGDLVPHHLGGRLRILAVTAPRRLARLPEVPTFAELGHPELTQEEWFGAFLPPRAPAAAVAALNGALGAAMAQPELLAAFQRLEFAPAHESAEAFTARIRAEADRWGPIVRASGFRPED